jgi:hypothetical protein
MTTIWTEVTLHDVTDIRFGPVKKFTKPNPFVCRDVRVQCKYRDDYRIHEFTLYSDARPKILALNTQVGQYPYEVLRQEETLPIREEQWAPRGEIIASTAVMTIDSTRAYRTAEQSRYIDLIFERGPERFSVRCFLHEDFDGIAESGVIQDIVREKP